MIKKLNTLLNNLLLKLTNNHLHNWKQVKNFRSTDSHYYHESYICNCGSIKHIKGLWNRKPSVIIINKEKNK